MKKALILSCCFFMVSGKLQAQRPIGGSELILDNDATHQITIQPPPGLVNSYTWTLPLFPPPLNSAFTEAGTLTGQMLRWDNTLGYWTPTSALFAGGNTPGSFVGIGTITPGQMLDVAGMSGAPNVRLQSLGGTTNWNAAITNTDGFVLADNNGDLVKRNPLSVLNQFSWLVGGNTNPSSNILGSLTNSALDLRTNNASRLLLSASGDITIGSPGVSAMLTVEPGAGGNVIVNNVASDNSTSLFLTIDGSNRVRTRSLSSILDVTANEGLVYESPNIKLGATNTTTNPFAANRFVNLSNQALTFTYNSGASNLLVLQGSNGNLGVGALPNTFRLEVAGHTGPSANNIYDLGSNTQRWRSAYVGPSSLYIGNGAGDQTKLSYTNVSGVKKFNIDPDDDGDIQMNVDGTGNLEFTGALEPNNSAGASGQYLKSSGANSPPIWANITTSAWGISGNSGTDSALNFVGTTDNQDLVFRTNDVARARFRGATFDEDSGAFEPYLNNTYSLGTPTHRWRDAYFGPSSLRIGGFISGANGGQQQQAVDEATISYSNGTLIIDKPLGSTGSMVPNNSDIFTLGSSTSRWKDLYLGPSSLHIGADTLEARISYEPSVAELRFNTNGIGPSEVVMHGNGNLAIANLGGGGLVKAAAGTGILSIATGGADFEAPLTFDNGLTRSVNNVKLGGALTGITDVLLQGYNLTFSGLGRVGIGTTSPANKFAVGAASQFQIDSFGSIAAATGITSSGSINFTSLGTGLVKSTAGLLSIATAGTDLESPLTFNNGLTRTVNTIKLGGALTALTDIPLVGYNLTFSGLGRVGIGTSAPAAKFAVGAASEFQVDSFGTVAAATGITSSGTIQFTSLGNGIVKSTAGILGITAAGSDYELPLTFSNGLTRAANTIKLGGALAASTDIPLGGFNLAFSGSGNVGIGDATPASPLTVGNGDLFQVDAAGDLVKIKNVPYVWPAANAAGALTNNGSGALSWAAVSAITSLNSQTGASQTFATSTTGTDFSISSASNIHTFNLPDADATVRGVVSTGAQVFGGFKTFANGTAILNQNPLVLFELTANGSESVTLLAPPSITTSYTLTFPADDGAASQVLTTDGSGNLSWTTPSGGGGTPAGSNTEVQFNNSGSFGSSSNFTYNGSTLAVTSTGSAVNALTSSTTDEQYALHGNATGSTSNQTVGVWGNASTDASANTGTIGVLATGSGRTTTGETNIALQLNDGELTMGRTTQAPGTGSAVEGATGGTAYTAEGPSGVIEIPYQDGGLGDFSLPSSLFINWCSNIQINNRYVTSNSIILVEVISQIEGSTNQRSTTFNSSNLTFTTSVRNRAAGSFRLTIDVFNTTNSLGVWLDATDGGGATDFDKIRVGYVIINPSR